MIAPEIGKPAAASFDTLLFDHRVSCPHGNPKQIHDCNDVVVRAVAFVDKDVEARRTQRQAEAYQKFLYLPEAQHIEARNFYRLRNAQLFKRYASQFRPLKLITIERNFGS